MRRTQQPPPGSEAAEAVEGRSRSRLTAKGLGIASAASAAGAVIILAVATQVAVQATGEPGQGTPTGVIAAESTDENAPEKVESVAAPTAIAAAYDQLSGDEVSYVRHLVSLTGDFTEGADVFGGAGLQYLSTDVADPTFYTDGQRRLTLLYYDYATNELVNFIVNVTAGTVEDVQRGSNSQPAPTDAETNLAWELMLADAEAAAALGGEFEAVTGTPLTNVPGAVELTAHSFTTDAASFGAETCGIDRCVQVLAQVTGGPYLTTSMFVVNLSTQTVLPVR